MKRELLVGYDKVANLDSPGYEDNEISYFLTKAQENVILEYINPMSNRFQESFEESEKVRKYFSNITMPSVDTAGVIKTSVSADQNGGISTNSIFYDLPLDLWLPIAEWIVTNDTCTVRKKVRVVTHDEYEANYDNPFKKPNDEFAWRLDIFTPTTKLRHELVTDGSYNITEYHVRYIKKPNQIVVDEQVPANDINCELDSMVHRRIVDEAVKLALETSEERRLSTFTQINNK